jgi:hypothetical protein
MFRKPEGIGTCPRDEVCSATPQMTVFQQPARDAGGERGYRPQA